MKIVRILSILSLLFLIGCVQKTYPIPEKSLRNLIKGPSFGVDLSLAGKDGKSIEYKDGVLTEATKNYIEKNLDTTKNRYFLQVDKSTGVMWIDIKTGKTKTYIDLTNEDYNFISGGTVSPTGKFIAVVRDKVEKDPWSELIIIDVGKNTYFVPLTDSALLKIDKESGCDQINLVDKKGKDKCDVEKPKTEYLIDFWSTDTKVEVLKFFQSSTLIYTVDMT